MAVFTWVPSFDSSEASRPRVAKAQMGDGYEQRVRMGLQTDPKTWTLQFDNRTDAERDQIRAFLEARGGAESFSWTTPWGQTDKRWVCEDWDITPSACNLNQIRATFRQVYDWSLITEVGFSRPAWDSGYTQFRAGVQTLTTPPVAPVAWVTSSTTFAVQGPIAAAKAWVTSSTTFVAAANSAQEFDPYFSQVSLLLHFEGANGSFSVTDSGPLGLQLSSSAVISTETSAVGSSSLRVPINGQVGLPSNSALILDGDFTLEWRAHHLDLDAKQHYIARIGGGVNVQIAYQGGLFLYPLYQTLSLSMTANVWAALAITRSGTTLRWFKDGALLGSVTDTAVYNLSEGYIANVQGQFRGFLDEMRITKGVCRYTDSYTVRTTPFPNA